jgi:hypothetical protein
MPARRPVASNVMSTQPNPAAKTERLLNLVICLLYTRRPLSKAKIRDFVPQYGTTASDEAFDRMFERDKDELRDLGIPLVTVGLGRRPASQVRLHRHCASCRRPAWSVTTRH